MRRLVLTLMLLICVMGAIAPQAEPTVLVNKDVRERLAEEWQDGNRYQSERIYNVWYNVETDMYGRTQYRVTAIRRAYEVGATPSGVAADIAEGATILHTHPPTSCLDPDDGGTCISGGDDAYQCFPSPVDRRTLVELKKPFALIQCDRWALVPFWPK